MNFHPFRLASLLAFQLLCSYPGSSQLNPQNVVSITVLPAVTITPGSSAEIDLPMKVESGYHVNSDKPNDPFLIGLRLTWQPAEGLSTKIAYPAPHLMQLRFSDAKVSVFTGEFKIRTKVTVAPGLAPGARILKGTLRYQACSDSSCLPPKSLEVQAPVTIKP